jgi:hypothetical protein
MPQDPNLYLIIGSFALASLSLVAFVSLRGWRDWIAYKRAELDTQHVSNADIGPSMASRIEVANLKERVKKLEAIAAGIDL